jgi:hypothetical protein
MKITLQIKALTPLSTYKSDPFLPIYSPFEADFLTNPNPNLHSILGYLPSL